MNKQIVIGFVLTILGVFYTIYELPYDTTFNGTPELACIKRNLRKSLTRKEYVNLIDLMNDASSITNTPEEFDNKIALLALQGRKEILAFYKYAVFCEQQ